MKISKKYTLRINPILGIAIYGTKKYDRYISKITISSGSIYDCNLSQLQYNILDLRKNGFEVFRFSLRAEKIKGTFLDYCIFKAHKYIFKYGKLNPKKDYLNW